MPRSKNLSSAEFPGRGRVCGACGRSILERKGYGRQHKKAYIGKGLPELTPVEIVGYEVDETGNPLALDNGWFTR